MVAYSCKHCFKELLQVTTRQQSFLDILQQLKLTPIAAEKERSFPKWRKQCDRMLKKQDGCNHDKWNKSRVGFASEQLSRAPDNRHHRQCKRCGDRSAQQPFKQPALHYPVGPRNPKERHRVRHGDNKPSNEQVYDKCRTPKQKRKARCDIRTKQK